ncbi:MAG: putative glycoside hydrolase [Oscillospiraceae bacterium]|nr:putative glycoside hydrolase [Oscillospiraceae bacterium]
MAKGLKIRRSKNLYKRRKSGLRKIAETGILVVAVAGLVFVGYNVADVLLNYEPPPDDEIPAIVEETGVSATDGVETAVSIPPASNDEPRISFISDGDAVYAPLNVLASSTALSSYLETVKSGGFNSIVVEMKDDEGRLLYQSKIKKVTAVEGVSTGTLTAEQIANAALAVGIKPIARINTLKDHIASEKIDDVSYFGWLDNVPGVGKRWANPFLDGTVDYISDVTAELYKAGFSDIIFANTIYPMQHFRGLDFEVLPDYITDSSVRFSGLGEFVNKVADKNPDVNILLEVSLGCFSGDDGELGRTAEVLRNLDSRNSGSLNVEAIILTFTRDDFEVPVTNSRTVPSFDKMVKDGISKVKSYSGDLEIIPLFDRDGLPDNERDEIAEAFNKNGLDAIIIRN